VTASTPDNASDLDPRIERSRRVIQEATIAEMAEVGYGAMTIEKIAKRAGVSKATLYRQWNGKLDLVESSLEMIKGDMQIDAAAPPRVRIEQVLTWLATYLADTDDPASACVPSLVSAAQYDPAVREFHHRFSRSRRRMLAELVAEGMTDGDFSSNLDPELTAELLVGPLFYRRLMSDTPFPPEDVPQVMRAVLGDSTG
jgi:AcrR family transcriptional regulator